MKIFNQILPSVFKLFAEKMQKMIEKLENTEIEARKIYKIISKLYNVIVCDCKCVINNQKNLHDFKVKNLAIAIVELLDESKTFNNMLNTFYTEYGLKIDDDI
jgi:hypothetical protein